MSDERRVERLRELLDAFDRHDLDAIMRGCDLWTFDADELVARKDSFWKLRNAQE